MATHSGIFAWEIPRTEDGWVYSFFNLISLQSSSHLWETEYWSYKPVTFLNQKKKKKINKSEKREESLYWEHRLFNCTFLWIPLPVPPISLGLILDSLGLQ